MITTQSPEKCKLPAWLSSNVDVVVVVVDPWTAVPALPSFSFSWISPGPLVKACHCEATTQSKPKQTPWS